jgi:rifampicin phosphotransferase
VSTSRETIIWLDEPSALDSALVGGKAGRLARLRGRGVRVPDGFVVPVTAYRATVEAEGLVGLVHRLAEATGDSARSRAIAAELRAAIEARDLPPDLDSALAYALGRVTADATAVFAVRSSAPNEDLAAASFAGQLDTFLNVPTAEVPEALRRCWASLWTDRAIHYRAERGFAQIDSATAVLVQLMVPCEVAGVAFSHDPVSGADQLVVEATWGLGESIARGEVEPDRYVVAKETLAEVGPARIGAKSHRRTSGRASGTRFERVPERLRDRRALSPYQLRELGELLVELESLFGRPQDVEWGLFDGSLYVFQTRPITTLVGRGARPASIFDDDFPRDGSAWTSGFLEERFPEALSPLGWSVIRPGFEQFALRDPLRYLGCDDFGAEPLTRLYRGHPYVAVEVFRRLYKLFPDRLLPEDAWRYFPGGDVDDRSLAACPRSLLSPRLWWSLARGFLTSPSDWSPFGNYLHWERFVPEYERLVDEASARLDRLAAAGTPVELLAVAAALDETNGRLLRIHRWSLTHADLLYTLLRRVARAWIGFGSGRICANLVAALGDRSFEMDESLRELAARSMASPSLVAAVRRAKSVDDLNDMVGASDEGRELVDSLRRFIAAYGHRSFSLDIARPSFAADPEQLLRLLGALLTGAPPRSGQYGRREQATRRARSIIGRPPLGLIRWPFFSWVLRLTQAYVRLREDERFYWQKGLAATRRVYLALGQRLAERGAIARAESVFFLSRDELVAALGRGEPADLEPVVSARRAEFRRLAVSSVPGESIGCPRFLVDGRPFGVEAPSTEDLRGQPASPGRVTGPVRIVHSPDELPDVQPGEVLVTRGADPGWTPLFGRIGGLVMESGGQLSHGSVVAREYGIPAVVGVSGATTRLRDGDVVLVDGETGTVSRLGPPV